MYWTQKFLNLYFPPTDIDDFIVDDDGQPITKKRGKKFSGYTDAWVFYIVQHM